MKRHLLHPPAHASTGNNREREDNRVWSKYVVRKAQAGCWGHVTHKHSDLRGGRPGWLLAGAGRSSCSGQSLVETHQGDGSYSDSSVVPLTYQSSITSKVPLVEMPRAGNSVVKLAFSYISGSIW